MEKLDIGAVIQDAISRFSQNRSGDKPPVFVSLAPAMTQVPWKNRSAENFVRRFIYETLLTSDPDAPIEVSLRRRSCLNDLNAFIGVKPSYWIQLRVTGRGIRVGEYADAAVAGFLVGALGHLVGEALAQQFHRLGLVAAGLGEGLFDIHHGQAGLGPQCLHLTR